MASTVRIIRSSYKHTPLLAPNDFYDHVSSLLNHFPTTTRQDEDGEFSLENLKNMISEFL